MFSPPSRVARARHRRYGAFLSLGGLAIGLGIVVPQAVGSDPAAAAGVCTATGVENRANYESDVIYQILTDRFYDGDPSNNNPYNKANSYDPTQTDVNRYFGGDWAGIEQKLPYLAGMGVSAIWISPPYNNLDDPYLENGNYYNAYHGYWAKDYFVPDEHWGDWAAFDSLVSAAHAEGIKVVIDYAPNHTSHVDNVEQAGLYRDGVLLGRYDNDTAGLFHHLGTRDNSQTGTYDYQYRDLANLADLSTENATVQDYLLDSIDVWLAHGVDGIRNDATLHQSDAFRTVFADHVNASADPVFQFGEYFIGTPDDKYDDYRTSPDRTGIDILDFELANVARETFGSFSEDMGDLKEAVERTNADYSYETNAVTWLDSHDKSRLASIQPNEGISHAALAFQLTTRGTPVIYYGTEQYLQGANGDAGRVQMTSFDTSTTAYQLIGALAGLRKENPALAYGTTTFQWDNADVLIYERTFFDNVVTVAINRSGTTYPITGLTTGLPAGTYTDVLGGMLDGDSLTVDATGAATAFDLGPTEVAVWESRASSTSPHIGAVGPTSGRTGDLVTIDGEGFGTTPGTVGFGGTAATIECWSDDEIKVTVPSVAAGMQSVTVTAGTQTSNAYDYRVLTGEQVQLVFHVDQATTTPGQQVYVSGNVPELGNWDPDAAVALPMFSPDYPSWFLSVSVPAGYPLEFKFFKKDASGAVVWEGGANRTLTSPTSGTADTPVYTWTP